MSRLIRNRRDRFALLLLGGGVFHLATVFSIIARNEREIATSLLNVTEPAINTREWLRIARVYAALYAIAPNRFTA